MSVPCVVADFTPCCATAFPEREIFSLYMQVETEVFVNEMRYLITVEDAKAVVRVNFSTCVFHILFHNVQYCYCKKLYNAEKRNLVNGQLKAQLRRQCNTHVT